ncbi:MAG: hypothetical protein GY864_07000, partial [Desulfobacterales bacterium]|nr:hypothetical protein [Desulfobacterales bacterium]
MKNPDKNIDPSSPERPWQPDKNIPAGSGRLSVIVVRGLGKVHSFEVSPWILALVSLFLILYLITSGVALYDYINTLHINRGQSESLERLQHEIEGTKKELEQSKHRMMILTGHIQDL